MSSDQSQSETGSETPADASDEATTPEAAAERPARVPKVKAEPAPAAKPKRVPRPVPPREPSPLDAELDKARSDVLDAITAWLTVAWEQCIVRALGANPTRALETAETFPDLRAGLRELQSNARQRVEDAVGPLLDPEAQMREAALINSVEAAQVQLVGLIGRPLLEQGFDPPSGGLERWQDGYRLKSISEHDEVIAALRALIALKIALVNEIAERNERERNEARAEVERLWRATAED